MNTLIFPICCDPQRVPCGIAISFESTLERVLLFKCFCFKQLSFKIRFLFSVKSDIDSKSKLGLTFNRLVLLIVSKKTFYVGEAINRER